MFVLVSMVDSEQTYRQVHVKSSQSRLGFKGEAGEPALFILVQNVIDICYLFAGVTFIAHWQW